MDDSGYRLVYDAATVTSFFDPGMILFPCIGVASILFYLHFKKRYGRRWLPLFLLAWVLLVVGAANVSYWRLRYMYLTRTGQYDTVEGLVTDFHPMPASGHDWERITVDGVTFQYSDFEIRGGFNNTTSHGGPIREGMRVRIAYRNGRILRLWIADGLKQERSEGA